MTPCNVILGERNGKYTPHFLFEFAYITEFTLGWDGLTAYMTIDTRHVI